MSEAKECLGVVIASSAMAGGLLCVCVEGFWAPLAHCRRPSRGAVLTPRECGGDMVDNCGPLVAV